MTIAELMNCLRGKKWDVACFVSTNRAGYKAAAIQRLSGSIAKKENNTIVFENGYRDSFTINQIESITADADGTININCGDSTEFEIKESIF